MTLDKCEIQDVYDSVCDTFLHVVETSSKLNTRAGSNSDMNEELELMYYLEILSGFTLPPNEYHFNNQYASFVSTRDLGSIHNRAMEIRASFKTLAN